MVWLYWIQPWIHLGQYCDSKGQWLSRLTGERPFTSPSTYKPLVGNARDWIWYLLNAKHKLYYWDVALPPFKVISANDHHHFPWGSEFHQLTVTHVVLNILPLNFHHVISPLLPQVLVFPVGVLKIAALRVFNFCSAKMPRGTWIHTFNNGQRTPLNLLPATADKPVIDSLNQFSKMIWVRLHDLIKLCKLKVKTRITRKVRDV